MESDLINRFNEKDELTLSVVFKSLYPGVLKLAVSIIKDNQESEDVVLISFQKLFNCGVRFQTYDEIKGYLIVIIRNESLNYLKSIRKKFREAKELIDDSEDIKEQTPALIEQLYTTLNSLPYQYKKVLLLSLEGYSDKEIAMNTGTPNPTIRKHKERAIKMLKSLLNN